MAGRKAKVPAPKRMSAPTFQHQDPPGTTYRCTCCGNYYTAQRGNFLSSYSSLYAGWGGFFPVCKSCLSKYYDWLLADICDGDEAKAVRRMLQLFDLPFDNAVYAKALAAAETPFMVVSTYIQRLTGTALRKHNATYANTMYEEHKAAAEEAASFEQWKSDYEQYTLDDAYAKAQAEIDELKAEIERLRAGVSDEMSDDALDENEPNEPEIDEEHLREMAQRFGAGFSNADYEYLQAQYEDWIDCYPCETKIQEELFKNISLAQLNIIKAQHSDNGDVAKATKAFNDLVLLANIAPKQQKDVLSEADTFGTLIERWEKEEPIPEPDPAWADVDGIKRNISTWFFGHLCKMFKIENDWAQMYEDEIAPYTAHPPEYQGDVITEGGAVNEQAEF